MSDNNALDRLVGGIMSDENSNVLDAMLGVRCFLDPKWGHLAQWHVPNRIRETAPAISRSLDEAAAAANLTREQLVAHWIGRGDQRVAAARRRGFAIYAEVAA